MFQRTEVSLRETHPYKELTENDSQNYSYINTYNQPPQSIQSTDHVESVTTAERTEERQWVDEKVSSSKTIGNSSVSGKRYPKPLKRSASTVSDIQYMRKGR